MVNKAYECVYKYTSMIVHICILNNNNKNICLTKRSRDTYNNNNHRNGRIMFYVKTLYLFFKYNAEQYF